MFQLSINTQITLAFCTWILLTIFWIRWRNKKLMIFKELQIPGPKPHFIFGNILEINRKGFLQCQEEWIKKYGPVVGYYHGLKPVLMITDKEILKRIFIKDFHLFSERPDVVPLRVHSILDPLIPATKIMDNLILNQKAANWKRIRSKLSSAFSSSKLKMMIPFVDQVSEITLSILEQKAKNNEITDIYKLLQYLTLDVICAQAFGLNTSSQVEGEKYPLFRSAKTATGNDFDSKILIFGFCFPEVSVLGMVLNYLRMFYANGFSIPPLKITNIVGKVIKQRRNHPEMRRKDILQSLIDAYESSDASEVRKPQENNINNSESVTENKSNENTDISSRKQADLEIKAGALVIFLAGYETTSSSLAYTIYMLAKYPKYQDEIIKEIENVVGDKKLDFDNIKNLQLLERFMLETMRFYPPAVNVIIRKATENVDFGHFQIPKGMEITVPVNYMHFNEDNWKDPEVFDPDRFLLERRTQNQTMTYWAFGNGPRNCIGARLATITSKIIVTKMLQRFIFTLPNNPDEANLSVNVKLDTMVPHKVLVKVKERMSRLKEEI